MSQENSRFESRLVVSLANKKISSSPQLLLRVRKFWIFLLKIWISCSSSAVQCHTTRVAKSQMSSKRSSSFILSSYKHTLKKSLLHLAHLCNRSCGDAMLELDQDSNWQPDCHKTDPFTVRHKMLGKEKKFKLPADHLGLKAVHNIGFLSFNHTLSLHVITVSTSDAVGIIY